MTLCPNHGDILPDDGVCCECLEEAAAACAQLGGSTYDGSGRGRIEEPALRFDADKSRVDLIDPAFILALGDHYAAGAKKYAERNWEKGMSFSRCYASAQRHMLAFWAGEELDAETGSPHVIAAAWNMAALHHYMSRPDLREKFDDRPKFDVSPVDDTAAVV